MTDLTQRICPIMFWALVIFSIFLKKIGAFEQNVVDLQSGAQIRVLPLPLLDVLIKILSLPVTAAVSIESVQLLTYCYCLVALLPSCCCSYWCGQNWMVRRNLMEDACLPRTLCLQKFNVFIADLSQQICPIMVWALEHLNLLFKNLWCVWENVVMLNCSESTLALAEYWL